VPGERLGAFVSTRSSLGILGFSSLTGDRDEDRLSRALVQDIVTEISQHREIKVMTGAVPTGTHPSDLDVHQMKSLVNARYILTGVLQRADNALRVNVRLVEVGTGQTIWAERFDGDLRDLLAFQDRVTQSVAVAVRINLQLTTWRVHDKSPQGSPDVRRIVNQALTRYYEMTRESLLSAVDLCEQALQLDPANARAMRTESVAMTVSFSFAGLPKTTSNVEKALKLAEAAVRAVPDDEISRVVFSHALLCAGRNEEALAELGYAIDINPNYPSVHGDLAEQYALMGRTEEAMAAANQALRLSSYDPLDFWRHYSIVVAQFAAERDQETLDVARKVVAVKPQFLTGALYLAAAAAATDNMREAARAIDLCLTQLPNLSLRNAVPSVAQRYLQRRHHERFIAMLRKAGLPP
jgi:TolB-like protein